MHYFVSIPLTLRLLTDLTFISWRQLVQGKVHTCQKVRWAQHDNGPEEIAQDFDHLQATANLLHLLESFRQREVRNPAIQRYPSYLLTFSC